MSACLNKSDNMGEEKITDKLPPKEQLTIKDYNDLLSYIQEAGELFKNVKQIKVK